MGGWPHLVTGIRAGVPLPGTRATLWFRLRKTVARSQHRPMQAPVRWQQGRLLRPDPEREGKLISPRWPRSRRCCGLASHREAFRRR